MFRPTLLRRRWAQPQVAAIAIVAIAITGVCTTDAHAEAILQMDFEGNTANQGSLGSANNGTMFGNASYSTDAIRGSQSVDMGSTGYVKVPSFMLGDSFTIASWVKADFTSKNGMYTVCSTRSSAGSPSGALFFVNLWNTQNRGVYIETGDSSNYAGTYTSPGVVQNNEWEHLALTVDRAADIFEIYVNGDKLPTSGATYETFADDRAMYIGAPGTLNVWHFDGKIDDFRVYDSVLSANEVQQLVSPATPVPLPAAAWMGLSLLTGIGGVGAIRRKLRSA